MTRLRTVQWTTDVIALPALFRAGAADIESRSLLEIRARRNPCFQPNLYLQTLNPKSLPTQTAPHGPSWRRWRLETGNRQHWLKVQRAVPQRTLRSQPVRAARRALPESALGGTPATGQCDTAQVDGRAAPRFPRSLLVPRGEPSVKVSLALDARPAKASSRDRALGGFRSRGLGANATAG